MAGLLSLVSLSELCRGLANWNGVVRYIYTILQIGLLFLGVP